MDKKMSSYARLFLLAHLGLAVEGAFANSLQVDSPHLQKAHQHAQSGVLKSNTIQLTVPEIEDRGNKKWVQIKLTNIKEGRPITLADLQEIHTEKIHLLIIDEALEDYHHLHPSALPEAGLYAFEWTPKKQGNYRIWADLFPLNTRQQEYAIADLVVTQSKKPLINKQEIREVSVEGYHFKLSFDQQAVYVNTPIMGKIVVTDSTKKPIKDLAPIMGAFAHIVGFFEEGKKVVHIHPTDKKPVSPQDRIGPALHFHFIPERAGFIKLFAQVSIKGKEIFVPFGIKVQ